MLDFDNRDLTDSFEDEFRKKSASEEPEVQSPPGFFPFLFWQCLFPSTHIRTGCRLKDW